MCCAGFLNIECDCNSLILKDLVSGTTTFLSDYSYTERSGEFNLYSSGVLKASFKSSQTSLNIAAIHTLLQDCKCVSAPIAPSTPIPFTYTPPTLNNGQQDIQDVPVAGALLVSSNIVSLQTNITAYQNCMVEQYVIADGLVRVIVTNQTGGTITLPTLSFVITFY